MVEAGRDFAVACRWWLAYDYNTCVLPGRGALAAEAALGIPACYWKTLLALQAAPKRDCYGLSTSDLYVHRMLFEQLLADEMCANTLPLSCKYVNSTSVSVGQVRLVLPVSECSCNVADLCMHTLRKPPILLHQMYSNVTGHCVAEGNQAAI